MPVFLPRRGADRLHGDQGHWLDIGGKEPYSTDTVDVFQEGTIFPGVKLYRRGELVDDIYRMALANSRVPKMVAGDINAEVVGVRARRPRPAATRRALRARDASASRSSGCSTTARPSCAATSSRSRTAATSATARWTTTASTTSRSRSRSCSRSTARPSGSTTRTRPTRRPGRSTARSRRPSRRAASIMTMLAGGGEAPNEGHFRPIEVVARPGSMFHPQPPAPCFLYGWPAMQAMEAIYNAVAEAMPEAVPRVQRRRHLRARLVGRPRGDRRAVGRRLAAPGRPGRARSTATASARLHPHRGGDALLADRGVGGEEPVAAGAGRARAGLGRARAQPRRARRRHVLPHARGRFRDLGDRADEERAVGARGRRRGAAELRRTAAARRDREADCKGDAARAAEGLDARLPLRRRRRLRPAVRARPRRRCSSDVREGYITEEHARRHYPHAFNDA